MSCVGRCLVNEHYSSLLDQVNGVNDELVQDVFRVSNNCEAVVDDGGAAQNEPVQIPPDAGGSVASEDVAAILNAQSTGGVSHVMGTGANLNLLQKEGRTSPLHSHRASLSVSKRLTAQ